MNISPCWFFAEVAQPGTARDWKSREDSSSQEFKSPPRRIIIIRIQKFKTPLQIQF